MMQEESLSNAPNLPTGISMSQIQLPAGGGTIRSPIETIGLAGYTGAATFRIPIPVSACRGFEPALSLNYASSNGNSLFGMGFDLALAGIRRRTSAAIPRYDDSDVFMLDGDVLVPVDEPPATRSAGGKSYRVTGYVPRVANRRVRTEHWQGTNDDAFWRVLQPDGNTQLFGRSAASRIADPLAPDRVYAWLVDAEFDTRGNARLTCYHRENADNVPAKLNEQNRSQTANLYPARICYGNTTPLSLASGDIAPPLEQAQWHFEVVFDYGEYDLSPGNDTPYAPVRTWPARLDPFSSYASGFERRTHRLCRGVLMFHRFTSELGPDPVLTQALRLEYDESPSLTRLATLATVGYRYRPAQPAGQRYFMRALAPTQFTFVPFAPPVAQFQPLTAVEGFPLPGLQAPPHWSLVDLYGEGIPGVLYSDGTTTRYWSPVCAPASDGLAYLPNDPFAFPAMRKVDGPGLALESIEANGIVNLVDIDARGEFAFDAEVGARPFHTFDAYPTGAALLTARDASLSGNGRGDRMTVSSNTIAYYPSLGLQGYGPREERLNPHRLPPSAGEQQSIMQADPLGAGGQHYVRIANGRITVWPNLGYGNFGRPVEMANVPLYADFDAQRVRLADINGSGALAFAYIHPDRVDLYPNLSGNGFALTPIVVPLPVTCGEVSQVSFADVLGNGNSCLVVTSADPQPRQWFFDLCAGRKPYLLQDIDDNLGAVTTLTHASSSHFYLHDKRAGRPWITSLPFPVQVLSQIETVDALSGTRLVRSFAYHHGAYDHIEREFRGFGAIDTTERESAAPLAAVRPPTPAAVREVREWYDVGAWELGAALLNQYRSEWFDGDPLAYTMPASVEDWGGQGASPGTRRQARIALAGSLIRREVHGLDTDPAASVPFTVEASNYVVRLLQPAEAAEYAVFTTHPRETIAYTYDRQADDPQVRHSFTLAVNAWNQVERVASVAYGRRDVPGRIPEQQQAWAACTLSAYTAATEQPDLILEPLASTAHGYALTRLPPPDIDQRYYSFACMAALADKAAQGTDAVLTSATALTWMPDNSPGVPAGTPAPQALLLQRSEAAFSPTQINAVLDALPVPGGVDAFLAGQGGYRLDDGLWWKPGPRAEYAGAEGYFLPVATIDPFAAASGSRGGTTTRYAYDPYHLLMLTSTAHSSNGDSADQTVVVNVADYQKLAPVRMTDADGIVRELVADPLGAVVATSFRGKEYVDGHPQATGFAELPVQDPASWPQAATLDVFVADPAGALNGAAAAYFHDARAWIDHRQPPVAATAQAALFPDGSAPAPADSIELTLRYTDGTGRELATMMRAEPGDAFLTAQWRPGDAPPPWGPTTTRWIAGARTRFNSAGEPFRTYQPCYLDTWHFIATEELGTFNLAVTRTFDALGRVTRTDFPKAPFERAFFALEQYSPWEQVSSDVIDTIKDSDYYHYYIVDKHPLPDPEREALERAAALANTPNRSVRDSMGRAIREIALLLTDGAPSELSTATAYDAAGRTAWRADPRLFAAGMHNFDFTYDLAGGVLKTMGCDGGTRITLADVAGQTLFGFDGNGVASINTYDSRGRPVATSLVPRNGATGSPVVLERRVYGDSLDGSGQRPYPPNEGRNLAGKLAVTYDNAGQLRTPACSVTAQPLSSTRRLPADFRNAPNWHASLADGWTWADLFAALDAQLQSDEYPQHFTYDARGRSTGATLPDRSVITQDYFVSSRLARVKMGVAGAAPQPILADAAYDARNQVEMLLLASPDGTPLLRRGYAYDADTGMVRGIRTTREADQTLLQNLFFAQDPVGNMIYVTDLAAPSQRQVSSGQVVTPDLDYTYDSLYRLSIAQGRAMKGLTAASQAAGGYRPFFSSQDSRAVENYTERFGYDDGNNLTTLSYQAASSSFVTRLTVEDSSNRAYNFGDEGGNHPSFAGLFDGNGNQLKLPGIPRLAWTAGNQLAQAIKVERTDDLPDAEYYAYDAGGNRVRKVWQTKTQAGWRIEETIFCGSLEIWRLTIGDKIVEETHRLRVSGGNGCLCENLTWTVGAPSSGGIAGVRYPLSNNLDSATLEVDAAGRIASYEEYSPFGATVYAAAASLTEISRKEYRFNGRRRDRSTGLTYYGARYAAPWLGRWLSADPAGPVDGLNLFAFVDNNPTTNIEANGMCKKKNADAMDEEDDPPTTAPPRPEDGSGAVGNITSKKFTLQMASDNFFELDNTETHGLTHLVDRLNRVTTATSTSGLDIIDQYQIRRVFRDMAPLNFAFNQELVPLWQEANKGDDTERRYTLLRKGMTPVLKEELPETYDESFFRKPEIHHATYQSIVREWENTPQNLYLVTRGGRGIIGQHDALHLISSAGHGSQWKTLVPSVRSVVEDETGMKLWSVNSRPEYLFAPRQVNLTDDRVTRTDLNKLLSEAVAIADGLDKSVLPTAQWTFRMNRL